MERLGSKRIALLYGMSLMRNRSLPGMAYVCCFELNETPVGNFLASRVPIREMFVLKIPDCSMHAVRSGDEAVTSRRHVTPEQFSIPLTL